MDEAGDHGAMDATSRVGVSFGLRFPDTFYEEFASILEACEIEEDEETSGGAVTLHTPVFENPVTGPRAGVRPRETDGAVAAARWATEIMRRRFVVDEGKTPRHRDRRLRRLC